MGACLGHAIHYQFAQEPSAAGPYAEARVVSQHPLNDSNWHHLTVEFSQGEFRLTVDHFESFLKMEYTTDDNTDRRIIIGGIPG